MRDNGIDMWIHWIRMGNPDPLEQDLGAEFGVFIFTDRGGERIERAVLQPFHLSDRTAYDIVGDLEDLRDHVHERDPQRIGINSSAWLGVADGMSRNDYQELVEAIGPVYAERLVSAEQLITDFRVRRVRRELAAFSTAGEMTRRTLERVLSNEVITPGLTTRADAALVGAGSATGNGSWLLLRSQHAAHLAFRQRRFGDLTAARLRDRPWGLPDLRHGNPVSELRHRLQAPRLRAARG